MLHDKVALVTGGGSGLGRAGAVALAGAGARVAVVDVDDDGGRETVACIGKAGGDGCFIHADVGDAAAVQRAVADTVAAFGALHVLYNNAGIAAVGRDGFTPDIAAEDWDRVVRINLGGVFLCSKYAIPEIARAGGGAIINTASSMAHLPLGGLDAYAASKGGVAMLTKSMAVGCAPLKIRVNAISPGYVDTPMNAIIWGDANLKGGFEKGHLLGLQRPGEIASVVVFLASDASASLTGAILNCDAGWTAFKRPDLIL